ncbi:ImmA/IrrE family metallo-endopeptidase [Nocardioides sp. WG-D5]
MIKKKGPAPQLVARRLADLVVTRFNLTPPVDVEALVAERADLQRMEWPFQDTDAIILGLGSIERPRIFYRATKNPQRERFTLAHEMGHLTLPWHLPRANCQVQSEAGLMDLSRYTSEDEADVFASCLLLPDRWLLDLTRAHGDDMTRILQEVEAADVTTLAALRGLRRTLLAGWAFVAYRGEFKLATPGTDVPYLYTDDVLARLKEESVASGSTELNGHRVDWFQLAETLVPPSREDGDERSVAQILKDALGVYAPEDVTHLVNVCNGKVGGSLREWAGRPAVETYSSLVYRFRTSEHEPMLTIPDFRLWLAEKTRDVEQNGQAKRRR